MLVSSSHPFTDLHRGRAWDFFRAAGRYPDERRLHRVDKCLSCYTALESSVRFRSDYHDFFASMHGDVLRPFTSCLAYELAESSLRILAEPITGTRTSGSCFGPPR